MSIVITKKPNSTSSDGSIGSILTVFDDRTSLYIVFEDGTILVGTT